MTRRQLEKVDFTSEAVMSMGMVDAVQGLGMKGTKTGASPRMTGERPQRNAAPHLFSSPANSFQGSCLDRKSLTSQQANFVAVYFYYSKKIQNWSSDFFDQKE